MGYLYLAVAIVAEVIATNALKASEEFTKLTPSIVAIIGYASAFYFLSLVLLTFAQVVNVGRPTRARPRASPRWTHRRTTSASINKRDSCRNRLRHLGWNGHSIGGNRRRNHVQTNP